MRPSAQSNGGLGVGYGPGSLGVGFAGIGEFDTALTE